jgi:hypothetical protein
VQSCAIHFSISLSLSLSLSLYVWYSIFNYTCCTMIYHGSGQQDQSSQPRNSKDKASRQLLSWLRQGKVSTVFLGLLVDGWATSVRKKHCWFTSDLRLTGMKQRLKPTIEKSLNIPKSNEHNRVAGGLCCLRLLENKILQKRHVIWRSNLQISSEAVAFGSIWL